MDNLDQKIKSLQEQGMSIRAIGRELGLSHVAIMKRLKKDKNNGSQNKTGNLDGNSTGNLTSKSSNQEKLPNGGLTKRGPEHCSKWQTCGVCNLEPDQRKMLEEMYLMGFPEPLLADYFKVSPTGLASHAWLKHWWSKRKKHEDPSRKEIEREVLSRELWKTITASEVAGDAKSRILAMKLAAQMQGMGEAEKGEAISPGVTINMRFSLNSGDQEQDIEEAINLLPEQNEENR